MRIQFANGRIYDASTLDEAIKQCLASGHDPFNPKVIADLIEPIQDTKDNTHDEDSEQL